MNLKRDNWTNEEVIELLQGRKLVTSTNLDNELIFVKTFNEGIDFIIDLFDDFRRNPDTDYSAKALNTDTGLVVAIGPRLPQ